MLLVMLFNFLVGLTDIYVAGFLGPEIQAVVGFVSELYFFIIIVANAISVGSVAMLSRAVGAGNMKNAMTAARQSLLFGALCALALMTAGLLFYDQLISLAGFPDNITTSLAWFGRSEKFGNFYAGVKGDADEAVTRFDAGMELLAGGEWVEKGEGVGTAPSLVVEAIVRALQAKGETVDEDRLAGIREKCKDKDVRAGAKKDPAILAHVKAIEAERAQARAEKAQADAEGQTMEATGF